MHSTHLQAVGITEIKKKKMETKQNIRSTAIGNKMIPSKYTIAWNLA